MRRLPGGITKLLRDTTTRLRNRRTRRARGADPHVLIIVQNLPVPLDRRVWLECQELIAAGYQVSVICIKGPGDPSEQVIDGVHIYKYRAAPEAKGLFGFALEFTYSWIRTAVLSLKVWRNGPFDVIQACNPPDTYWLLGLLWRPRRVRFVFDHHDLNPELFLSRFGEPDSPRTRAEFAGLNLLERCTFRVADQVISTNESYKRVAIERGGLDPRDVTVVRSGPDTTAMRPVYPDEPAPRRGFELAYLGIMGPQDGVEIILHVMRDLVHDRGRTDVHATLMGFGDCLERLKENAVELGVDHVVTFTGRADRAMITDRLSRADVGLGPDPKTPLNDVSTMNKTMEYMAFALPSVAFDLQETRISGGDCVLYVEPGDLAGFADAIERLLDDDGLRVTMGVKARKRVSEELDWRTEAIKYVNVYDRMFTRSRADHRPRSGVHATVAATSGRRLVDVGNEAELARFVRTRGAVELAPAAPERSVPASAGEAPTC